MGVLLVKNVSVLSGFATVLTRIAEVWREKKDLIREQSADTMRQLAEATQSKGDPSQPLTPTYLLELAATA